MTWTILHEIHAETFFDKALVKSIGGVNTALRKLLALREKCDAARKLLTDCDVLDVGERPQDVKAARLAALKNEVVLRSEVDAIEERVHDALCEAHNVAIGEHKLVEVEIRGILEEIGYHRFQISEPDPCRWTPGMVMAHPRVRATHDEEARLAHLTASRTLKLANHAALEVVEGELNREREKVLASA